MQARKNLKDRVNESKPFNRLIEFGFTPEVLQFVKDRKDEVIGKLQENVQQKEKRISDVEKYYKNGTYTKGRYVKEKKKAKIALAEAKKRVKNPSSWQSDELLTRASNVLNPDTENAMTSKFSGTDYVESKAKKLLPFLKEGSANVKDDEGYKNAWREILKKDAHQFPEDLANTIKLIERRRQAIMDLLAYYKIDNVRSVEKNKNSVLYRMLENINNHIAELKQRVKDPAYDLEIRVRDASTNEGNKVVLGEYAKKRKAYGEIKDSLKKGEIALNSLAINKPLDESRLFTPSVSLRFSSPNTKSSSNPLQLTTTSQDDKKERRKSVSF